MVSEIKGQKVIAEIGRSWVSKVEGYKVIVELRWTMLAVVSKVKGQKSLGD